MVTVWRRAVNCYMSARQPRGTRSRRRLKGASLGRTVQASTLTAGAVAGRQRLHGGSRRRGTTALGREDSDIHFTSHFTLYSHNLHFNTYYCNCMSSSSSSSSFICEREYNKPTWQSIIIEQMSAQDSHATRGCSNATSVHRDFFDYCTS